MSEEIKGHINDDLMSRVKAARRVLGDPEILLRLKRQLDYTNLCTKKVMA